MARKILSSTAIVRMNLNSYWSKQQPGKAVSVRELFELGPEGLVYLVCSEFAREGKLVRAAWGVYILPNPDGAMPPVQDIAVAKARGFGKEILNLNTEYQNSVKATFNKEEESVVYATSSCTSSFQYEGKTIRFFKVARRKFELLKSKAGAAFATLWRNHSSGESEIERVLEEQEVERTELRTSSRLLHLMPKWLKKSLRRLYPEIAGPGLSANFYSRGSPT